MLLSMSTMKPLYTFFLTSTLAVALAACGDTSPPGGGTGNGGTAGSTTVDLNIVVAGVPAAPVKVVNEGGETKLNETVIGNKTLTGLPKGKYTVSGGAVTNFVSPVSSVADLSGGNGTVTLNYTAAVGQALELNKIKGTINDAVAKGNKLGVLLQDDVLASATIGVDGNVSLALITPPANEMFPLLPGIGSNCTYTGSGAATAGKTFFASDLVVYSSQGELIGNVTESPVGGSPTAILTHVYADSAQSYQGTVRCVTSQGSFSDQLNVQLAAGWNALIIDQDSGGNFTVNMAPTQTRVQLVLDRLAPAVTIVPDTSSIALKPGGSATVNVTIYQDGGISGKVDLSTDLPGVTVSPASVVLPVLGTQRVSRHNFFGDPVETSRGLKVENVGTQSLSTTLTVKAAVDAKGFNGIMNLKASQSGKAVGEFGFNLNLIEPTVTATAQIAQGLTIERGQSVPIDVQVIGTGNYTGDAQISLENLPAGITATTALVSFVGVDFLFAH